MTLHPSLRQLLTPVIADCFHSRLFQMDATMFDAPYKDQETHIFDTILDTFHDEQLFFERTTRSVPLTSEEVVALRADVARSSELCATRLLDVVGTDASHWHSVRRHVQQHPVHRDFLMQSAFLAKAWEHGGEACDGRALHCHVQQFEDGEALTYAAIKEHVYQSIPLAIAMRRQAMGMRHVLESLPSQATVLCLDDEHESTSKTRDTERYDLIHTTGLRGACDINRALATSFAKLRRGGRLILGNILLPGGRNPHSLAHRFMLEVYVDWALPYRSLETIKALSHCLPTGAFRATLSDETLHRMVSPTSVISHLSVEKIA